MKATDPDELGSVLKLFKLLKPRTHVTASKIIFEAKQILCERSDEYGSPMSFFDSIISALEAMDPNPHSDTYDTCLRFISLMLTLKLVRFGNTTDFSCQKDTLIDLANYALLGVAKLTEYHGKSTLSDVEREQQEKNMVLFPENESEE